MQHHVARFKHHLVQFSTNYALPLQALSGSIHLPVYNQQPLWLQQMYNRTIVRSSTAVLRGDVVPQPLASDALCFASEVAAADSPGLPAIYPYTHASCHAQACGH